MMTFLVILLSILLALSLYGILIYNNLISLRHNIGKNWSNIEVLLKQRNSEIPKLIATCQEYMQYEQDTLQKIVKARETAIVASKNQDISTLNVAESALHSGLLKLFALAENYPELKTNQSFLQLQSRISDLENSIADRRELYNDSVNINNIRIQQFPDLLIAKPFQFKAAELLKFRSDELEDLEINTLFKR